ncbi:EAL domain-containing protein [Halobacillus andaensis]|nr:EAL domain-containing protein [Halobacillus andaensis]MBP2005297.1 PAS domain S-box-containing protein [Halobacillus andaensis]
MNHRSHVILEKDLQDALTNDEFHLYYQPKVDLTYGELIGAEALIRWKHPERGIISPGEFIPLAEDTGWIISIGEWVLRSACLQLKEWEFSELDSITMSVNLSVRQLYQPDFLEIIRGIIEETRVNPEKLELEITESMMMDIDFAYTILRELKNMGFQVSIDDFGKGYSSLHYLKKLPIDKIKIDQSFIQHCTRDLNDATIVKTMIVMAHQLNFQVVAEGVEKEDHIVFLQRNLCDEAQGYLFSPPVAAYDFLTTVRNVNKVVEKHGLTNDDVVKKKWMEEEVRTARQELLETVREQQGMTLKYVKRDGRFIHTLCDGELLYRMGLTPEQVVGRELKEFLPSDLAADKVRYYEQAWNGTDKVTYEAEVNGIHYIASLRPLTKGGSVVEVIGSCVDITERKKVEEALRKNEEKHRFITENISDLIKVVNVKGIVEYASPSHEEVLGFQADMYKGERIYDYIHPDDAELVRYEFNQLLVTKQVRRATYRHKHSDGYWVQVDAKGTPVLDEDQKITHAVVVARDVANTQS